MSGFFSKPRNLAILGAATAGAGAYIVSYTGIKTPGVKNIESRITAGGGSPNQYPATATKLGDPSDATPRHENPKGVDTKNFKDNISDQKVEEPALLDKAFNKMHYGNEKGK
ncbi:hypothetical protein M501DRAFT_993673 [Patellaria atrata CBS 101060]|uniref:Uncharacterized protein n=1 Tax=Patellaria atrata CBS 101060 TaxID=1346257 RepID=A0A9P4VUV9_9PEZI|nr:hypothetical protein M501DRAFT_993673 [Patellaria atrata CBS 101060]